MRKKLNFFLAEDDEDDRDFFRSFLSNHKNVGEILYAENGLDLLEELGHEEKNTRPDAIILDHNMPKLNGLQTLYKLKSDASLSKIPVFIYSTYADPALFDAFLGGGAEAVFPKPGDEEGYVKMIDAIILKINTLST